MTHEKENEVLALIEKALNAHDLYPTTYAEHVDIDASIIIHADIEWGDWKHDHLYYDYLIEEFAKENGFVVVSSSEQTTEEDGSDCYSAHHRHALVKVQQ